MSKNTLPELQETRRGETLAVWGIKLTKIYFICLLAIIPTAAFFNLIKLSPMSLNELGDFLAGLLGPLSIFWLVLGFFQQGSELRLQVTELSRSVEQQRELVSVSRETLSHEKEMQAMRERVRQVEMQPNFLIHGRSGMSREGDDGWTDYHIEVFNAGGSARFVKWELDPKPIEGNFEESLTMDKRFYFNKDLGFRGKPQSGSLTISYTDEEGTKHRVQFEFFLQSGGLVFKESGRSQGASV